MAEHEDRAASAAPAAPQGPEGADPGREAAIGGAAAPREGVDGDGRHTDDAHDLLTAEPADAAGPATEDGSFRQPALDEAPGGGQVAAQEGDVPAGDEGATSSGAKEAAPGEVSLDDPAAEAAVLSSTPSGGMGEEEAGGAPSPEGASTGSDSSEGPLTSLGAAEARGKIPAAGLEAVLTAAPRVLEGGPSSPPPAQRFARPLPRILALANQKGGVGKTTTTVNLGACLADLGYRVLVCDLDPQGNASTGLGLNPHNMATSMYDVILNDLPIEDCIEPSSVRNLFVAPASLDLAGAEIELVPAFSRELRLKRALEAVLDDYDFVLIDCPPSLGLLTVNGLSAAHEVVVPVQCEYYALEGLGQLLRNVDLVQRNLNPTLAVSAIICVMYDARTKLSDQVVQEVRDHFGDKVCRNVVPRTVRLSEAPSFGQPIIAFDPTSRGAIAYRELAKEISGGTPQRAR